MDWAVDLISILEKSPSLLVAAVCVLFGLVFCMWRKIGAITVNIESFPTRVQVQEMIKVESDKFTERDEHINDLINKVESKIDKGFDEIRKNNNKLFDKLDNISQRVSRIEGKNSIINQA